MAHQSSLPHEEIKDLKKDLNLLKALQPKAKVSNPPFQMRSIVTKYPGIINNPPLANLPNNNSTLYNQSENLRKRSGSFRTVVKTRKKQLSCGQVDTNIAILPNPNNFYGTTVPVHQIPEFHAYDFLEQSVYEYNPHLKILGNFTMEIKGSNIIRSKKFGHLNEDALKSIQKEKQQIKAKDIVIV